MSEEPDSTGRWPHALLARYPRAEWSAHDSATARFWLFVHDGFRQETAALRSLAEEYSEGRHAPAALAARAVPRLRGMVAHLHGHHEIEDHHYFPALRRGNPGLEAGFDALGKDHERLLLDIDLALAAARDLLEAASAAAQDANAQRHAADIFLRAADALCRHLEQHLTDEENLVIPLLLEQPDF